HAAEGGHGGRAARPGCDGQRSGGRAHRRPADRRRAHRSHHGPGRGRADPAHVMTAARDAAEAYVEAINAADLDALLELFADDAVLRHPIGVYEGAKALADFYQDVVFAGRASLTLTRLLADGRLAMFEVEASSALGEPGASQQVV